MALPTTMKAVKVLGLNHAEVQDVPLPELQAHEVLVKVRAVALNPVDWQLGLAAMPVAHATLGCDFTGTVAALGASLAKPFSLADRVSAWVPGNNVVRKDNGAFAEYVAVDAELCLRVPEALSDEEAASPAAGIATAGMGVFMKHNIPIEENSANGDTILIYGGTSATGTLAIQMAKLAGLTVLTTASPSAHETLRRLGAAKAFDYHTPTCGADINAHTSNTLTRVFDTISTAASLPICLAALTTDPAKHKRISTTLPWPASLPHREGVQDTMLFTLGIFGTETGYGESVIPANGEDYAYAKTLYGVAETWWGEGKLRVHPPRVVGVGKGLEGVFEAIEVAKRGEGGGVKLVVRL